MKLSTALHIEPVLLNLPARPKILLIRLSALGDVIQTLPILPLIRQSQPGAQIGWMIDEELVPSIAGHEMIDQIHSCPRKRWFKSLAAPLQWAATAGEMRDFIDQIRAVDYDVALDVQGLFKTGLLTYLSGAKHRVGFAHKREGCGIFYQHAYINRKQYHDPHLLHVDHMAMLTRVLGSKISQHTVSLPPLVPAADEKIAGILKGSFNDGHSIVVIAPGTQWESKLWSVKHWSRLVSRLLDASVFNIVFVGAPGDQKLISSILAAVPASNRLLDLSGKTSIQELYALCGKVQAVVACDSAPLHIAGAAHTPHLFGLFGPTGKARTAPIGSPHVTIFSSENELSCQPCHKRVCPLGTGECLERIDAEAVFTALIDTVPQCGFYQAAH